MVSLVFSFHWLCKGSKNYLSELVWSVQGLMYLEVENVLAQNKMAVWDFLKKCENAKKQMWKFHEKNNNSGLESQNWLWYLYISGLVNLLAHLKGSHL